MCLSAAAAQVAPKLGDAAKWTRAASWPFDQGDKRPSGRCAVADLTAKLVFERKDDLDQVQTVGAQILEQMRTGRRRA
jgi:hypothetical protein